MRRGAFCDQLRGIMEGTSSLASWDGLMGYLVTAPRFSAISLSRAF